MSSFKYKAFISYSHVDTKLTKWLHRKLEAYQVPKHLVGTQTELGVVPDNLFPIFRDRDELAATTHMTDAIADALGQSEFLIIVCTPSSAHSKLVSREIEEFKRIHGNRNILCLIARGVPFSGDPATECFSEVLKQHINPDGTAAGWAPEGLAADIRPGSDGKSAAVSKLVAGMLGLDLNDLQRRELQRERGKLVLGLGVSIAAFAVISGLLFATLNAQRLAEERTDALLNFLLESQERVFQSLDADGDTRTQETMIRMTLDYFREVGLGDADVKTLGLWSGTALRLGQNLERQGQNESAADLFNQIRDFSVGFSADNLDSHFARFRLQNAEFFYGYHQHRLGFYDEAERVYRNRLSISEAARGDRKLKHQTPGTHVDWDNRVSDGQQFLAMLLAGPQDKVTEAETLFTQAIVGWKQSIESFEPNDIEKNNSYQRWSLGFVKRHHGELQRRLGQFEDAQESFQESGQIYEDLLPLAPGHKGVMRRIAVAEMRTARTMLDVGDLDSAHSLAQKAANKLMELATENVNSVWWLSNAIDAHNLLLKTTLMTRDYDAAAKLALTGLKKAKELFERDKDRPAYRLAYYTASLLHAETLQKTNQDGEAETALRALAEAIDTEPATFFRTNGVMEFHAKLALLLADLQPSQANRHLEKAISTVSARPDPWPEAHAYEAFALQRLGREEEAAQIFSDLDKIGFDHALFLQDLKY